MFNIPASGPFILSINSILARQINIAIIAKNISRIFTTNYIRLFKSFRPIENFRTRNNIIMITKNIFHIYITKSVEIAGIEPTPRVPTTLKEILLTHFLQNRLIIRTLPLSYSPIVAVVGIEPTSHGLWGQWLNRLSSPHYNDGVSPTHRGLLNHTTDVHPLASHLTTGCGEPGLPSKTNLLIKYQ